MPLVTVCGIPGAGKTWLATRLRDHFVALGKDVILVNEESEHLERRLSYADSRAEKLTRGVLKSRVNHFLSSSCVVILDSLNYIKGCRYELFCLAKENSTTHCVVYVDTPVAMSQQRNCDRDGDKFPQDMVEAISTRFEMPLEKNRWDAPLIRIAPGLDDTTVQPVVQHIEQVILYGKTIKAGLATQAKPVIETSFLQELDAITSAIVDDLIARQREFDLVDACQVPHATTKISFSTLSISFG
ncbi:hypothetical protein, variant [Aphanomyces invadans]|uniref:Uncharacterized protein n=1 Tax=Aphanomyces invadans TaxID=157072 RepID=A0A024UPW4_9STRA|nr:hypothetical protein, variant [Aphanomyces invadans]ETW08446.1 hypothetical protein, variant [Aphanomyces invadans]|eukprot:XP_008862251.1 hypothetical protein, variant [Aphanomyces invadans]